MLNLFDGVLLAAALTTCAQRDVNSQDANWELDRALRSLEQTTMHDHLDPRSHAWICAFALQRVADPYNVALLSLDIVNGLRRSDDQGSVDSVKSLLDQIRATIDGLADCPRKDRLKRFWDYNGGVFYARWGDYRRAIACHSRIAAADSGEEGAISRYLVAVYMAWQAFVDGHNAVIEEASDDVRQALPKLWEALKGCPKEIKWGQAPAILHMLQVLFLQGSMECEEWDRLLSAYRTGSTLTKFGPQCTAWLAVFDAGNDISALEKVAKETNQHDAKAGAYLLIARLYASVGNNEMAKKMYALVTDGANSSMIAAVARRELQRSATRGQCIMRKFLTGSLKKFWKYLVSVWNGDNVGIDI